MAGRACSGAEARGPPAALSVTAVVVVVVADEEVAAAVTTVVEAPPLLKLVPYGPKPEPLMYPGELFQWKPMKSVQRTSRDVHLNIH